MSEHGTLPTCFLLGVPGQQLERVRKRLEQKGIICFSSSFVTSAGSVSESLFALISRLDFTCALFPQQPPANLMFELGIAVGLKKPVLLIAKEPNELPFDIAFLRFIRYNKLNSELFDDFLDSLLRSLPRVPTKLLGKRARAPKKALSALREKILFLNHEHGLRKGQLFEETVEQIFRATDFSVVTAPSQDSGVDFAIWSPELKDVFGLPILVQVKSNFDWGKDRQLVRRLAEMVRNERGSMGLIVSLVSAKAVPETQSKLPVVSILIDELIDWLERGTLVQALESTMLRERQGTP